MVGWSRRNRERDAEARRRERRFDAWWAKATDEEKAAWKVRQAAREAEFNRQFPRIMGTAAVFILAVLGMFLWLGHKLDQQPHDPSQPRHRAHLAP